MLLFLELYSCVLLFDYWVISTIFLKLSKNAQISKIGMIRIEEGDESSEDFRQWNEKMIQESAKMIRLVLCLLIIWTFISIGWTIHMILNSSSNKVIEYTYARNLCKRSEGAYFNVSRFENLSFYTMIPSGNNSWENIKTFIGTFHQLKESKGKTPALTIYTDMKLNYLQREEASSWNKVRIEEIEKFDDKSINKNLIGNLHDNFYDPNEDDPNGSIKQRQRVWIAPGYAFDPVALELRRANLLEEASAFRSAFEEGRSIIESAAMGCKKVVDKDTGEVVLRTLCEHEEDSFISVYSEKYNNYTLHSADEFGLMKFNNLTKGFSCHVDLRMESIENGAELVESEDFLELSRIDRIKGKKLAIGVPTTSKGMKSFKERHVLLSALIPSINATLTKKEIKEFQIVIFIAFDKGDSYFENETLRKELKTGMIEILPNKVKIVYMRLKPLKRVAMTWNMIFSYVRKQVRFDYFYQVNDDLTMITPGWLSKFSSILDKNGGMGVVGPSDSFNGFKCSLLTQSFVTEKHFKIFSGLMYPLEFRDWKSDRWLSFVYGKMGTFCDEKFEAKNGAKGTRYEACAYGEWKIVLERGEELVKKYLKHDES